MTATDYTTTEVAQQLGLTRERVWQLVKQGVLRGRKRGRDWDIDPRSVEELKRERAERDSDRRR